MRQILVTLNSERVRKSRRAEAEEIVRSYFRPFPPVQINYAGSSDPAAILVFPKGVFGSLDDANTGLSHASDAGEAIRPHVETELMAMLSTADPPDPPVKSHVNTRKRWSWDR